MDYDACRRVAYENVEDATRKGIDYIELRFSPWFMAEAHGLDPAGVVEAVCDGIAAGQRDIGLRTNLIGILSRTYGPEVAWKELDACNTAKTSSAAPSTWPATKSHFPRRAVRGAFPQGRDSRLADHRACRRDRPGRSSIWQAIQELGAQRIGHGMPGAA